MHPITTNNFASHKQHNYHWRANLITWTVNDNFTHSCFFVGCKCNPLNLHEKGKSSVRSQLYMIQYKLINKIKDITVQLQWPGFSFNIQKSLDVNINFTVKRIFTLVKQTFQKVMSISRSITIYLYNRHNIQSTKDTYQTIANWRQSKIKNYQEQSRTSC